MSETLHIDKDRIIQLAAECTSIADKLRDARSVHGGRYLGQTWRTGVTPPADAPKQLLGTAEYPHSGRTAGQKLATHISAGETAMGQAEKTLRTLAARLLEALDEFDSLDAESLFTDIAAELPSNGKAA